MAATIDLVNVCFRHRFGDVESVPVRLSADSSVVDLDQLLRQVVDDIDPDAKYCFYHDMIKLQHGLREVLDRSIGKSEQIIVIEYDKQRVSDKPDIKLKHEDWVSSVRFISNTEILSGSYDGQIRLYGPKGSDLMKFQSFPHYTSAVTQVQHTQDNLVLASYEDGHLRAFSTEKKPELVYSCLHDDAVRCFDLATNRILTGSDDGSLRLWIVDRKSKDEALIAIRDAHDCGPLTGVKWSSAADTNAFSCSYSDRFVKMWNVDATACIVKQMMHTSCLSLDFNGSRNLVLVSLADNFAKALDPRSDLKETIRFGGHHRWTYRIRCISQDKVLTGSGKGQVFEWDLRKSKAPVSSKILPRNVIVYDVDGITDSENATQVAIASQDRSVRVGPML